MEELKLFELDEYPDAVIRREWAMPSGNTFEIPPIKRLVERELMKVRGGVIIDPFANKCTYGTIRNDLNPEFQTDYHLDALEFLKLMKTNTADIVLFDPPYSFTQAAQLYKDFGKEKMETSVSNMKYWSDCKDNVARILKVGGKCLCFGWNTNGIGRQRGFVLEEVLDVSHGGGHNDTLCTVERKYKQCWTV